MRTVECSLQSITSCTFSTLGRARRPDFPPLVSLSELGFVAEKSFSSSEMSNSGALELKIHDEKMPQLNLERKSQTYIEVKTKVYIHT